MMRTNERFVGTATTTFKGIDIIVNNAGYTWDGMIQKTTTSNGVRLRTAT